jgi:hypothetical protein
MSVGSHFYPKGTDELQTSLSPHSETTLEVKDAVEIRYIFLSLFGSMRKMSVFFSRFSA